MAITGSKNGTYASGDLEDTNYRHARTFAKIPTICNGQFNNCENAPTRMVNTRYGAHGYCDSCMLDMVLQANTVTVRG